MPQVSRAQTAVWRFQSAWGARDIFHEFAVDYAKKVEEMTGGRLKFDVLAAGSVVPAFQTQDAVHAGILEGGHGVYDIWYRKRKAASLFGSSPSFGWDAHGMLEWFYSGGGEALYRELVNDILKLNLTGLLCFPMPAQPLGWFKKEISSVDAFKGISYRSEGLGADVFRELGASVTILPSGKIVSIMDRGLLDAAGLNNPSSDIQLGLSGVAKFYMMGSHHRLAGPSKSFSTRQNTMHCRGRSSRSCVMPHSPHRPLSSAWPTPAIRRISMRSGSAASAAYKHFFG